MEYEQLRLALVNGPASQDIMENLINRWAEQIWIATNN